MKAVDIIKIGSQLLKKKNIQTHIIDSEILLSKTLKRTREEILTNLDQIVDNKSIKTYKKYLYRRLNYEPIAYILEEKRLVDEYGDGWSGAPPDVLKVYKGDVTRNLKLEKTLGNDISVWRLREKEIFDSIDRSNTN